MTRDEAIKILHAIQARGNADGNSNAIDSLVALGMLKLDEPKSAEQIFWDRLESCGNNLCAPIWDEVRESLQGFEIVEK